MNNYYVMGQYHNEFVAAESDREAEQWFESHFPSEEVMEVHDIASLIAILAILNESTDDVNEMMLLSIEERREIHTRHDPEE